MPGVESKSAGESPSVDDDGESDDADQVIFEVDGDDDDGMVCACYSCSQRLPLLSCQLVTASTAITLPTTTAAACSVSVTDLIVFPV